MPAQVDDVRQRKLETLPLALPPQEQDALARSAAAMRAAIDGRDSP